MSLFSSGTLIVIIPSNQGVVVAADSISSVGDKIIKNRKKINFPTRHSKIILTVTGTSEFYPALPPNTDLENWLNISNPKFSAPDLLLSYIDSENDVILDEKFLIQAAELVSSQLERYVQSSPLSIIKFQGKEIFRPILIQYCTQSKATTVGTFVVLINHRNKPIFSGIDIQQMSLEDERYIGLYGESKYVNQQVLRPNSVGSMFLPKNINSLWNEPRTVKDMSANKASEIAKALISATESASKIIPIESAVGGKPTVLLMNDKIVSL